MLMAPFGLAVEQKKREPESSLFYLCILPVGLADLVMPERYERVMQPSTAMRKKVRYFADISD